MTSQIARELKTILKTAEKNKGVPHNKRDFRQSRNFQNWLFDTQKIKRINRIF